MHSIKVRFRKINHRIRHNMTLYSSITPCDCTKVLYLYLIVARRYIGKNIRSLSVKTRYRRCSYIIIKTKKERITSGGNIHT